MKESLQVIKVGGKVIDDEQELDTFLKGFATISGPKVLIHGGGKIATEVAERLGIKTKMVEGRRVTNQAMLEVVTMVYGGLVNKRVVVKLQALGCNAIGLSGADMNYLKATKRPAEPVDYGFVGDIQQVNSQALGGLLEQGVTPILAPLTHDGEGHLLNTNADSIASAAAIALSNLYDVKLYYCFEKAGVLTDVNDDSSLIETIDSKEYERLKAEGVIADGMIPKLENAFKTMHQGVKQVCIMHHHQINHIGQSFKATTLCL